VVVIVGGLGQRARRRVGSIVIGLADAYSRTWLPELSTFAVFAPMAIILVPAPLLG
jgi:branched-subunit amino acid ABC-type transport system permease component